MFARALNPTTYLTYLEEHMHIKLDFGKHTLCVRADRGGRGKLISLVGSVRRREAWRLSIHLSSLVILAIELTLQLLRVRDGRCKESSTKIGRTLRAPPGRVAAI